MLPLKIGNSPFMGGIILLESKSERQLCMACELGGVT